MRSMPAAPKWATGTRRRALSATATHSVTGLAVLLHFTAACAIAEGPPDATPDTEGRPAPTATPATTSPPETRPPEITVSTTEPPTTTEAPAEAPSTTDSAPVTTVPLPGEPSAFGPAEGAVWGVDHDDVRNVRDVPAGEIIATLGLLTRTLAFSKSAKRPPARSWPLRTRGRTPSWQPAGPELPTTTWHELRVAGLTGWSSAAYVAQLGATDDVTAHIIEILGERPEADTMLDLGFIVAEMVASDEPPSRIVVSVAPIVFEGLGEIMIDVVNIGDDSVLGFRLGIVADAGDDWMSEEPVPSRSARSSAPSCATPAGV